MSYYRRRKEKEMKQIVADWAIELSKKLNRPTTALIEKGLYAGDFSGNSEIEITFPDDSRACFKYAFFIDSIDKEAVAIFTEHCGYFVFSRHDLKITEIDRKEYFFD